MSTLRKDTLRALGGAGLLISSVVPLAAQFKPMSSAHSGTGSKFNYPHRVRANRSMIITARIGRSYRWLEDPDSAETRSWVEAENRVTFGYLDRSPNARRSRRG